MATYRRWYDTDPKLSTVVRAMEDLNEANQRQIAGKLLELSEDFLKELGGAAYLSSLSPEKQAGLKKSQAKKRWHDQYEAMHEAFNNFYALDNPSRRDIADRMSLPVDIIQGYEAHCAQLNKTPDIDVVAEALRCCFTEGQNRAKKLYMLYLPEFSHEFQAHQKKRLKAEPKKGLWTLLLESIQNAINPV